MKITALKKILLILLLIVIGIRSYFYIAYKYSMRKYIESIEKSDPLGHPVLLGCKNEEGTKDGQEVYIQETVPSPYGKVSFNFTSVLNQGCGFNMGEPQDGPLKGKYDVYFRENRIDISAHCFMVTGGSSVTATLEMQGNKIILTEEENCYGGGAYASVYEIKEIIDISGLAVGKYELIINKKIGNPYPEEYLSKASQGAKDGYYPMAVYREKFVK